MRLTLPKGKFSKKAPNGKKILQSCKNRGTAEKFSALPFPRQLFFFTKGKITL